MPIDPTLNTPQRQAVAHKGSPLLVLAGAGSGKTRVITQKIAHLINDCAMNARHITAVTFTNKAAREMKQRIGQLIKGQQARGLTVSTFHSLGLQLLRGDYHHLGYRRGFSIFDAQDSEALLRELTHKSSQGVDIADLHWRISNWKNALHPPELALTNAEDETSYRHAQLYARYQRQLAAYNALDFDDLIAQPTYLLQQYPEVRERWQTKIRHLLIDEYQDTNACQYSLMKLLIGIGDGLTVVGDEDQTVYAWRGARPENIGLLIQDFPRLKVIKLEQNYRSSNRILQTANGLIANNSHLFAKRLWSERGTGEQLRIIACKSSEHEAQRLASEILKLHFKNRDSYSNYAILYRSNHQSRPIEKALREHSIPYQLSGGTSFFERAEVKDVLAYLRLLANPEDDPAFLRIVNTPRRHIGASTLEKLGHYAAQRQTNLMSAAGELGLAQQLPENSRLRLGRFTDWLQEMTRHALEFTPADITRRVIEEIHYREWLLDSSKNRKAAEKRIENVNEFLDWISRLSHTEAEPPNLEQLVAHFSLRDIIDRHQEQKACDAVHLMTLHAAKGLEFPFVWIAGMEEELLPHRNNLESPWVDEERRLAYVGITRAQQRLSFTYAVNRSRFGELIDCEPSRFLHELPQEHVVWEDVNAAGPGSLEARQTGKAHLSNLKSLLAGEPSDVSQDLGL